MSNGTYARFPHAADVYTKTTTANAAGQRATTYSLSGNVKVLLFSNLSADRRLLPYVENINEIQFYISYKDASYVEYSNRVKNFVDRYGNVVEAGPFEIININKQTGLNGKVRQLSVTCKRIIENA